MSLFISSTDAAWKEIVKKTQQCSWVPSLNTLQQLNTGVGYRMSLKQHHQKNYYLKKQENVSLCK